MLKAAANRPFVAENDDRFSFVGLARVHRLFKGARDVPVIKLVTPETAGHVLGVDLRNAPHFLAPGMPTPASMDDRPPKPIFRIIELLVSL